MRAATGRRPALAHVFDLARQGARYLVVSAVALGCDLSVYALSLKASLAAPAAGALGYGGGLAVQYVLSAFWVFPDPVGRRRTQATLAKFVATGLLGLALTSGLIGTLTGAGLCGAYAAKIVAIAVSTVTVFAVRRAYVFAASMPQGRDIAAPRQKPRRVMD
jgi:putative flippase GtrA